MVETEMEELDQRLQKVLARWYKSCEVKIGLYSGYAPSTEGEFDYTLGLQPWNSEENTRTLKYSL